ncbi:PQQ-dependent sugar dehydrogenase [Streptomyces platensis]|uniref:PQQ-dependent sugar dehydrogenase n=1 Tax=Streptomyces platensis TaxID=58346 RepID=A0AAE6NMY5_STRPT|nr:PQQ-dependent sugar dehydrogenase [Streptomyces platensis]OSY45145.1 Soluble aldose sugar dehydrogenase YliI precursor [Streptomyces platensis]QEV54863.1 PQQ-dependent sugar dehydrogenase [Streptomyces platensis]
MQRRSQTAVLAAASLLLAAGCSSGGAQPEGGGGSSAAPSKSAAAPGATPESTAPPAKGSVKVTRTLATGLTSPWGVAVLPGGDLLVASRDTGKIVRIAADSGKKTELGSVPGVDPGGEGGLLGIAVSSAFGADHQVYAYFTTASDNRIARMNYDEKRPPGNQLGAPDTLFKGIPKGQIHNGGRIAFGPDKMLYAGTGETGDKGLAQDKDSPAGKILRMTPDGEPAHGNPEADSVVYDYGHRNVQGLAWDNGKRLWASEFGQDTWDELNLIEPGKNYGWPEVEGKAKGGSKGAGFVNPVEQWKTADASPSGIAFAKGSVWMASLRGERLWRIPLDGTKPVAAPQAFLKGTYGRLRTVVAAGDGTLWLVTSNTDGRGTPHKGDDRILRLKVS